MMIDSLHNKVNLNYRNSVKNDYSRGYHDGFMCALSQLSIRTEYDRNKDCFTSLKPSWALTDSLKRLLNNWLDSARKNSDDAIASERIYAHIDATVEVLDIMGMNCIMDSKCRHIDDIVFRYEKEESEENEEEDGSNN